MIIVSPASRRMGERGGAAGYMSRSLPATSGILTVKICQMPKRSVSQLTFKTHYRRRRVGAGSP